MKKYIYSLFLAIGVLSVNGQDDGGGSMVFVDPVNRIPGQYSGPVPLLSTLTYRTPDRQLDKRRIGGRTYRRGFQFRTTTTNTNVISFDPTELLVRYDWKDGLWWRGRNYGSWGLWGRWLQAYIHEDEKGYPGRRLMKFSSRSVGNQDGRPSRDKIYDLRSHLRSTKWARHARLKPNTHYWIILDVNYSNYWARYSRYFHHFSSFVVAVYQEEPDNIVLDGWTYTPDQEAQAPDIPGVNNDDVPYWHVNRWVRDGSPVYEYPLQLQINGIIETIEVEEEEEMNIGKKGK